METEINEDLLNVKEETLQNLRLKKNRLTEIRKLKIEDVIIRSRSRYQDLGEKPTKFFLGLENRHYTNKLMSKITDSNGIEYTETKDILNCQKQFYNNLYDRVNTPGNKSINNFLEENEQKLSHDTAQKLEGKITYAELLQALKSMKNDKSPGLDGFTADFFKFFLD